MERYSSRTGSTPHLTADAATLTALRPALIGSGERGATVRPARTDGSMIRLRNDDRQTRAVRRPGAIGLGTNRCAGVRSDGESQSLGVSSTPGTWYRYSTPHPHGKRRRPPTYFWLITSAITDGDTRLPGTTGVGSGAITFGVEIASCMAASMHIAHIIREGKVSGALIMGKLGSYARQNKVAKALREMGRIEKTFFIMDYISSESMRRRIQRGLKQRKSNERADKSFFLWEAWGTEGTCFAGSDAACECFEHPD
ncbi:hypothetical protein EMIT07CA2_550153 [Brevibacillus sp. IT-7CA2]